MVVYLMFIFVIINYIKQVILEKQTAQLENGKLKLLQVYLMEQQDILF